MFAKLLKYEFRKSRDILGILSLCMLGIAVLTTAALKIMVTVDAFTELDTEIGMVLLVPLIGFAMFSVWGYAIGSGIMLLIQFYQSKFTDEGYLTFTLPVNSHQIYLSSLLNIVIWNLITFVTLTLSIGMVVFLGTSPEHLFNPELLEPIRDVGEFLSFLFTDAIFHTLGFSKANGILWSLSIVLTCISQLILPTASITVGCTIAKKYKVLASIGCWFLAANVSGIVYTVCSMAVMVFASSADPEFSGTLLLINSLVRIVLDLVIIIGGYILTTQFMEKKLNLS